jgi:PPOX class probable F420-dependent enzyme
MAGLVVRTGNNVPPTVVGGVMDITAALAHAATTPNGILITLKRDGRPQSSNVSHHVGTDGVIRVSVTADRAKAKNAARDQRVSLHVNRDDFWSYVVIEATAELTPVAADPSDATVDELVDLYRSIAGEHDDWDDYRAAMVRDGRLVIRLHPTSAYGMWHPAD